MVPVRLRRALSSQAADQLVRVVVVASIVVSGFLWGQLQGLTACVARYNNANNVRSVVLTEATNQERAAERKADDAQAALFLDPALNKPPSEVTEMDRARVRRLLLGYQAALAGQKTERAAADDARAIHPIPDPPSEVCG